MSKTAFQGNPVLLDGEFVSVGTQAPEFTMVKGDLSTFALSDAKGKFVVLNIFPSLDTAVCAASVRKFNQLAANCSNTIDWPFPRTCPLHRGVSAPPKA